MEPILERWEMPGSGSMIVRTSDRRIVTPLLTNSSNSPQLLAIIKLVNNRFFRSSIVRFCVEMAGSTHKGPTEYPIL